MTDLVALAEPRSSGAEAYQTLRTNLAFVLPGRAPRRILVTSPSVEEDKSTPLANLAVVMAQAGQRVAVVDADLRRPAQHRLFGLDNESGLSTVLACADPSAALPMQGTTVPALEVMTSGPLPPNPAALLSSPGLGALVERLSGTHDVILFDAPPIVAVADAAIVAPLVDGVLLVLAAGASRRDHARRARELLDKVGARVLGVVLTGVEPVSVGYGDASGGGAA